MQIILISSLFHLSSAYNIAICYDAAYGDYMHNECQMNGLITVSSLARADHRINLTCAIEKMKISLLIYFELMTIINILTANAQKRPIESQTKFIFYGPKCVVLFMWITELNRVD